MLSRNILVIEQGHYIKPVFCFVFSKVVATRGQQKFSEEKEQEGSRVHFTFMQKGEQKTNKRNIKKKKKVRKCMFGR